MNDRALNHALETGRGLGTIAVIDNKARQVIIDIIFEIAAQNVDIDTARLHDSSRIRIVQQRQEQMLKRGIFMVPLARQ